MAKLIKRYKIGSKIRKAYDGLNTSEIPERQWTYEDLARLQEEWKDISWIDFQSYLYKNRDKLQGILPLWDRKVDKPLEELNSHPNFDFLTFELANYPILDVIHNRRFFGDRTDNSKSLNELTVFPSELLLAFAEQNPDIDIPTFFRSPNGDYYDGEIIDRFYNLWDLAGRPNITPKDNLVNIVVGKGRPHINGVTRNIGSTDSMADAIAEIAHIIENNYNVGYKTNNLIDGLFASQELIGSHSRYDNDQTMEGRAHQIVEDGLLDYVHKGLKTKYLPKKPINPITHVTNFIKNNIPLNPVSAGVQAFNTISAIINLFTPVSNPMLLTPDNRSTNVIYTDPKLGEFIYGGKDFYGNDFVINEDGEEITIPPGYIENGNSTPKLEKYLRNR